MGELYLLTFPNGKRYVGITMKTASRRRIVHLHHARKGRKGALQAAIRKYGAFEMRTLVVANNWEYLCELEQRAIAAFETQSPKGYNLTKGGEGSVGVVRSPEWSAKMSASHKKSGHRPPFRPKGWKHSDETKKLISAAGIGRVFSEERRAKIAASKIGNKYSAGRIYTEEQRRRISESNKATKAAKRKAQNGVNIIA